MPGVGDMSSRFTKHLAWLLIVVGLIGLFVAWGMLRMSNRSPEPVVQNGPTAIKEAPSIVQQTQQEIDTYNVAPDLPKYMAIDAAGVKKSKIVRLGQKANGQIASPGNINDVGWFADSAKPGKDGVMFMFGHVSSWETNGVFYELKKLKPKDKVRVTRGDDQVFTYEVVQSETYAAALMPMEKVLAPIDPTAQGLNLMTCAGKVIKGTSDFTDRLVVYTKRVPE